jgi:hypothetical protein
MYLVNAAVLEKWKALSDADIIAHVVAGRTALFEVLMRRYAERVYRTCRAIVADDKNAEQLVVDAFVDAYSSLRRFDGTTPFAIWLTHLVVARAARNQEPEVVCRPTGPANRKESGTCRWE